MRPKRQGEPCGVAHGGEVHDSRDKGRDVAHNHAEEQGAQLPHALGEVLEDNDHREGDEGHNPAPGAAEPLAGGIAAGHIPHGGGVEGKADGKDDRAGDQRGEELADGLDENTEEDCHKAADELGAQDCADAEIHSDSLEGGDVGEADAHDDRQAGADAAKNGEELEQGGQCRDNQGDLDEQGLLLAGEVAYAGHNHGRGDDAHHGGHYVLETQGDELPGRGNACVGEDGLAGLCGVLFHHNRLTNFF